MFGKIHFCFILIWLQIHWGVGTPHQPIQLDAYATSRSFPQLDQQQQHHLFDASQNYYVPNNHNSQQYTNYAVATAAPQPYGYNTNGSPNQPGLYQYPTPSTHSQLWSSAPIVVPDDADNIQISNDYKSDLQTRPRTSKALPLTYNSNRPGQQQQQQQPSNYNYPNPAIYHNSDVWRQQQQHLLQQQQHSINTSPPQSGEENSLNYNRQQTQYQEDAQPPPTPYPQQHQQQQLQQQHHHHQQQQQQQQQQQHQEQQHRQHQLYASNTDLNYLQATPINHRPYSSAGEVGGKDITADYTEHFKEYLRKHPRRIKPIY